MTPLVWLFFFAFGPLAWIAPWWVWLLAGLHAASHVARWIAYYSRRDRAFKQLDLIAQWVQLVSPRPPKKGG